MAPEADPHLPFNWEGSPAPDPASATPAPRRSSRRVAPRLVALALGAAVLGGALAVALSGGDGAGGGGGGPIALAASVTNGEPGFKFDLTVSATVSGQTSSVAASGAFDAGPPLSGSMDATVGGTTVNELIVGSDVYVQTAMTGGKWLETALPGAVGAANSTTGSAELTSADPGQTLQYLRAAGSVTDDGPATIGGIATTHFHADIDLSRYVSTLPASKQAAAQQDIQSYEQATGSSTLPMDVWIDGSNLVRQIQFDLSISGGSSVAFSMNFSDYGPQPAVSPPPAADVIDVPQTPSTSTSTPTPTTPPVGSPSSGSPGTQAAT